MYLVQKNRVRGLSQGEYTLLLRLARLSKNVYNTSLWHIRQFYESDQKYLSYPKLYPTMREDANYRQLPSQVAQQTMRYVDRAVKSFFQLLKRKQKTQSKDKVEFPHYRPKDGYYPCVFSKDQFKVVNDGQTVRLSLGRHFTTHEGCQYLFFTIPPHIRGTILKEVRIIPQWRGKTFDIEFVYLAKQTNVTLDSTKHLAIDLGLDNFATCVSSSNVTTTEPAFILEGRGLKSWNQWWNKTHAKRQAIQAKQKTHHLSHQDLFLSRKRRAITRNFVAQAVNYVVKHCLTHAIGSVIIGALPDLKRGMRLGKRTNQAFQAIPIGRFKANLKAKCELYGIRYTEVDEAYTSQTCAGCGLVRKANRVHRGLDLCRSCGVRLNADVNGALNIGSKVAPKEFSLESYHRSSCCVNQPKRISVVAFRGSMNLR